MTEQEIEAMKRNIEKQLEEYKEAINAAAAWHEAWKARQPKGFKVRRNQSTGLSTRFTGNT